MKLQVQHIAGGGHIDGETAPYYDSRITINPYCMQAVASADVEINGTKLKKVTIFFADGDVLELNVNTFDAAAIEDLVGMVPEF